jgi:hypothetical protein
MPLDWDDEKKYGPRLFILGPDHQLISCSDVLTWGKHLEEADRIVAQTGWRKCEMQDGPYGRMPVQVAGIQVSTVFLGLDHRFFGDGPPLVFETMVFGGPLNGEQERYGSWAAAEAGHKRWVKKVFPALARRKGSSSAKSAHGKSGSDGARTMSTPPKPPACGETTSTPTSAPISSGPSAPEKSKRMGKTKP